MSCNKSCFEAEIVSCSGILIRAAFPPNYGLYWVVSKVGSARKYQRLATTNNDGDLLIPSTDLPAGFLTTGKALLIVIKNGADYQQPVTLVFGAVNYSCAIAKLVSIDKAPGDGSETNVIQFTEAIVPGGGGGTPDSLVIPFVNQTVFVYNHNLGRSVDTTIYDLSGNLVLATVTEDTVNFNFVTITFTSPTSGRLLIN